jgi:hypothetical protein
MSKLIRKKWFKAPSQYTLFASKESTLDDLLRSEVIRGKHIHCQFQVNELTYFYIATACTNSGVVSIAFKGQIAVFDDKLTYS